MGAEPCFKHFPSAAQGLRGNVHVISSEFGSFSDHDRVCAGDRRVSGGRCLYEALDFDTPDGDVKHLLIQLARIAGDKGFAWIGQDRLARRIGRSVRTLRSIVNRAEKAGFLSLVRGRLHEGVSTYELHPDTWRPQDAPEQELQAEPVSRTARRLADDLPAQPANLADKAADPAGKALLQPAKDVISAGEICRPTTNTTTNIESLHFVQTLESPEPQKSTQIATSGRQVARAAPELALTPPSPQRRGGEHYPPEFTRFWLLYPRRISKRPSLIAWRRACRRAGNAQIILQTLASALHAGFFDRPTDKIPYPENWLASDPWHNGQDDESAAIRSRGLALDFERAGVLEAAE